MNHKPLHGEEKKTVGRENRMPEQLILSAAIYALLFRNRKKNREGNAFQSIQIKLKRPHTLYELIALQRQTEMSACEFK